MKRQNQRGSALLVTMGVGLVIGIVLGSILMLTSIRNEEASRSLAWNAAIPVLEAGIEEGLTHLHNDTNNPTANGWTGEVLNGRGMFWKRRDLPDGSFYYVTNADILTGSPIIYAAGYVPSPLKDGEYISRLVQVTATNPPSTFNLAIAANGTIRLSGSSVVDGYNSSMGRYDTTTNRNASGGIATDSRQTPAINVGSAHIYGTAVTGPGGSVAASGGSVGDLGWSSGIEGGWTDDNMNVQFLTNSPPTGTTGVSQAAGITTLVPGTYTMSSFICNDSSSALIITGPASGSGVCTLLVPGNFIINNTGYVYISTNVTLVLYVGGVSSISGGGIINGSGKPSNFSYIGLSSNTTLNYSGSADFVGTINAPQANFSLSGSGSVYGAIICNTLTSSGSSQIHYDQALIGGGIFLVTAWRELP